MATGILHRERWRLFANDLLRLTPAEPHGEGKGEQILEQKSVVRLAWVAGELQSEVVRRR